MARAVLLAIGAAFAIPPFVHHVERAGEKRFAAGIALNFSAGGSGNASRLDEHDGVGMNFVRLGERAADRGDHILAGNGCAVVHFLNDDQSLRSIHVNGKRSAASGPQRAVAPLDGVFQILGIVVGAANDDEIFQSSGDEELSAIEKSEVAGAKEGAFAGGQMRAECLLRLRGLAPIAARHARTRNPDFSHAVRGAWRKSFGIDNRDFEVRRDSAAAHQDAAACSAFFRRLDSISLQLLRQHGGREGRAAIRMA